MKFFMFRTLGNSILSFSFTFIIVLKSKSRRFKWRIKVFGSRFIAIYFLILTLCLQESQL